MNINWYNESKIVCAKVTDEQIARFEQEHWNIVENIDLLGYDIILAKSLRPILPNTNETYQIGIQKDGMDFTDYTQQMMKQRQQNPVGLRDVHHFLAELKPLLTNWKSRYYPIFLGSLNPQKTATYAKILTRLGIPVTPQNIGGHTIYVLSK